MAWFHFGPFGAELGNEHAERGRLGSSQAAQGATAWDAVGLWEALAAAEGKQARQS